MLNTAFFEFFVGLSGNNNRTWFEEHKADFVRHVKTPFYNLVEAVIAEMQEVDPTLVTSAKEATFRIYRDVRFSKDKTPYKTHMAAHITHGERAQTGPTGLYVEVGSNGALVGGGVYQPSTAQLLLVRDLLMHEGKTFRSLLNDKQFKKYFPDGIVGDKHKVIAKEFRAAAELEPLIYNKQFLWMANLTKGELMNANAAHHIASHYRVAKPLSDFFAKALA